MTARDNNNIPLIAPDTQPQPIEEHQAGMLSVSYSEHLNELNPEDAELRMRIDARTEYLNSIKLLLS